MKGGAGGRVMEAELRVIVVKFEVEDGKMQIRKGKRLDGR